LEKLIKKRIFALNTRTMHQLLVNIKDDSKMDILLNFLKSLNYISVEEIDSKNISLTEEQKNILDKRRTTAKSEDFMPWNKAKKQLKFKSK
jgi:hypothetical protein